jgi:hypothetical protein
MEGLNNDGNQQLIGWKTNNHPTIQQSNNPTIQPFNHSTIKQSNHPITHKNPKQ